jgi:hypothetical protein
MHNTHSILKLVKPSKIPVDTVLIPKLLKGLRSAKAVRTPTSKSKMHSKEQAQACAGFF